MTCLDPRYLDGASRRKLVGDRHNAALPIPNVTLFVEGLTHEILADYHVDLSQAVSELVKGDVDRVARQRDGKRRRAEVIQLDDGRTSHVPFEELAIWRAEAVARRKISNGEASIATGMADLAVVNAASIAATRAGLSLTDTTIEEVLSSQDVADLRGETRAAA